MGIIRQDYFLSINQLSPPDNTIWVFGPYAGGSAILGLAAENNNMMNLPIDVTLVQCEARLAVAGTLGTAENMNIQLYVNSGAGGGPMITDLSADQRINYANNRALSYGISTADYFDFLVTSPAWATNPTSLTGLIITCYYETGLDRNLSLQTFYLHPGLTGIWNPAIRTTYYTPTVSGFVSTTNDMPYNIPFSGNVVGAVLNCKNNGTGSADAIITEVDVNGSVTPIDNTWAWNNGSDRVVVPLDSISVPFVSGDPITVAVTTPNWATPPTNTTQSISLLIEES